VPNEGESIDEQSDLQLLQLHVDTLFAHDARGRIRYVNEPGGERAPRFFFGRSREGNIWRGRDDLADETWRVLDALASKEPVHDDLRGEPRHLDAFLAAPRADRERASIASGPAYRFPDAFPLPANVTRLTRSGLHVLHLMAWDLEEAAREFERREPYVAVVENGATISLCHSARLTDQAAEAGVQTVEAYRGRGYASAVVAGWANTVRATGRIALYSTSWNNLASQGVARKLRLVQYGTDLSLG
jgi:RimJ/RimL family protein N-acetyltransferase